MPIRGPNCVPFDTQPADAEIGTRTDQLNGHQAARNRGSIFALIPALGCAPIADHAGGIDNWCSQVKRASSSVICSDAELREQAISRNQISEAARQGCSTLLDGAEVSPRCNTGWAK
jgi:hypothetical protein